MSLLPSGYTRLEYIQSSAEATYINLGITPSSNNLKIVADAQPTVANSSNNVLWQINPTYQDSGKTLQLGLFSSKWQLHMPGIFATGTTAASTARRRIAMTAIGTNWELGGVDGSGTNTYVNTGTWRNQNITVARGMHKHYGYEVYLNGVLVRCLVPAKNPSGTIGMYDIVTSTFYANAGSGSYTAGGVVSAPVKYAKLTHIESSGAQYVDTGFSIVASQKNNSRVLCDCQFTDPKGNNGVGSVISGNIYWLGCYNSYIYYGHGTKDVKLTDTYDGARRVWDLNAYEGKFSVSGLVDLSGITFNNPNATGTILIPARTNGFVLYSCDIYNSGSAVRNFVPYMTVFGTAGLMDELNGKFYASVTATDFTAGNEIVEEYTPLAWIESTGAQYLDTGFGPSNTMRLVMKAQGTGKSANGAIFGARDETTSGKPRYQLYHNGTQWWAYIGTAQNYANASVGTASPLNIDCEPSKLTINGETFTYTNSAFKLNSSLYLFGINQNATVYNMFAAILYSCQIYDNGKMVRDYEPALLHDGRVGLVDKLANTFYPSATSTAFIAGPEIVSNYTPLAWIESTGSQYVDSKVYPNQNTRVVMDAQLTANPASGDNPAYFAATDNSKYFRCIKGGTAMSLNWEYGTVYNLAWSMGTYGFLNRRTIDANGRSCTIDGNTQSYAAQTFEIAYPMFLLASNNAGSAKYFASAKLYSCKVYSGATLARDYEPALLDDGRVGLVDKLCNAFYGSASGTAFIAGPEIVEEYTELEWIESTGEQYVDTGFKHNQNTRVKMDVTPTGFTENAWLFEGRNSTGAGGASHGIFYYYASTKLWSCDYAGTNNRVTFDTVGATDRMLVDYDKNKCTINGEVKTHASTETFQSNYNLYLLADNRAGVPTGKMRAKLHSTEIYDNGVAVRDYVPALLPDGRVGLVDTLENAFYGSATSTAFIAGDEKITVPVPPANLKATVSGKTITLSWDASENATGYDVYRNGVYVETVFGTQFTETFNPAIDYGYSVTAYNDFGYSEPSHVTVYASAAPDAPKNLRVTYSDYSSITIAWDPVEGANTYKVYRNGVLIGETAKTMFTDKGLEMLTAYAYYVSASNSVGDTASGQFTAETTAFKLVTDRTAADVEYAKELGLKNLSGMTDDEILKWMASLKGAYNITDLSRVENAVLYVIERLHTAGWYLAVESKLDWTYSDYPSVSEMQRYLNNIRLLRNSLPTGLPKVADSILRFSYVEANDIERILEMLDEAVVNIMKNVFYVSEIYSGEVQ